MDAPKVDNLNSRTCGLLSPSTIANLLVRSRAFRNFVAAIETKLPPLREWHRFQYQVHFAQSTSGARLFSGVYENSKDALAAVPIGKGVFVGITHICTPVPPQASL